VPNDVRLLAERRADVFLTDMRQFSGLLVERGQNAFGFRHLTFQEYFAARALARMRPEDRWTLLHLNLHANRWREPILLAAARLGVTENRSDEVSPISLNRSWTHKASTRRPFTGISFSRLTVLSTTSASACQAFVDLPASLPFL
jgi:predicted NACHT family NTPase